VVYGWLAARLPVMIRSPSKTMTPLTAAGEANNWNVPPIRLSKTRDLQGLSGVSGGVLADVKSAWVPRGSGSVSIPKLISNTGVSLCATAHHAPMMNPSARLDGRRLSLVGVVNRPPRKL
jgi:hypothetical protein